MEHEISMLREKIDYLISIVKVGKQNPMSEERSINAPKHQQSIVNKCFVGHQDNKEHIKLSHQQRTHHIIVPNETREERDTSERFRISVKQIAVIFMKAKHVCQLNVALIIKMRYIVYKKMRDQCMKQLCVVRTMDYLRWR